MSLLSIGIELGKECILHYESGVSLSGIPTKLVRKNDTITPDFVYRLYRFIK